MKIFFVLHGYLPDLEGGSERAVHALAKAVQAEGHEPVVVAGSLEQASSDRVDEYLHDGIRVLRMHRADLYFEDWWKSWSPGLSARFERLLAEERPDVVHVHHWIRMSSDLVRIAQKAGCTTAVTLHDFYTSFASPVRSYGQDEALPPSRAAYQNTAEVTECLDFHRRDFADEIRAADLRFAPSKAHADGLCAMADQDLGPIFPSPPPLLDIPKRRPAESERGKRLLMWGSIYPDKGVDIVIDALQSVGGGWTLDVLGEAHDPAYRERLEQRTQGIASITFHGRFERSQLETIPADYAILPSRCHESYGLILDEALCLGLPVIAADLPAYREHAPADSIAFFAPDDPGALAVLLLDPTKLAALKVPERPELASAADSARELIAAYLAAQRGEHGPVVGEALVSDADRAAHWARLAERRLWTALQGDPKPPPPDFLL